MLAPDWVQQMLCIILFMCSYTVAIVLPYLSGSFIKVVHARETFIFYFPNQKKWKPIIRENVSEYYRQGHSNLHRQNSAFDRSQGI